MPTKIIRIAQLFIYRREYSRRPAGAPSTLTYGDIYSRSSWWRSQIYADGAEDVPIVPVAVETTRDTGNKYKRDGTSGNLEFSEIMPDEGIFLPSTSFFRDVLREEVPAYPGAPA
jgi:hypothetical protein